MFVLAQLIWTVVLNCQILEDLKNDVTPRHFYTLNAFKGLTDMTVFCRFIHVEHTYMYDIVHRDLMWHELTLRLIGKVLEVFGGILIIVSVFHLSGASRATAILLTVFVAWFAAYLVNFVLAFVVSTYASWLYMKRLR